MRNVRDLKANPSRGGRGASRTRRRAAFDGSFARDLARWTD